MKFAISVSYELAGYAHRKNTDEGIPEFEEVGMESHVKRTERLALSLALFCLGATLALYLTFSTSAQTTTLFESREYHGYEQHVGKQW